MASKHSILSPSAAHRWLACTPSARFEEQLPGDTSPYAEEGTLAHELAALVLSARAGTFTGDQTAFNGLLVAKKAEILKYYNDQEKPAGMYYRHMYDHAEEYAAYVLDKGGEILIERSYDLSMYVPLAFGTADATNVTGNVLYITDYKYGAGVRVAATGNKQLMLYALGALADIPAAANVNTVVLSIYQPRAGGSSSWEIPKDELMAWAHKEVSPKAALAIAGAGEFVAGEHCQFCKARTSCKAYYDCFSGLKKIMDKRVMTTADIAQVLRYGPMVSSWAEKVKEESTARLQNGETIPGFKLVAGRGRRSFRDEDMVVDTLLGEGFGSEGIYDTKLKALTEVEKMLGPKRFKALFDGMVVNIAGKPQLAPEEDSRPALALGANEYD